jgi:hypothetical protein
MGSCCRVDLTGVLGERKTGFIRGIDSIMPDTGIQAVEVFPDSPFSWGGEEEDFSQWFGNNAEKGEYLMIRTRKASEPETSTLVSKGGAEKPNAAAAGEASLFELFAELERRLDEVEPSRPESTEELIAQYKEIADDFNRKRRTCMEYAGKREGSRHNALVPF